MGTTARQEYREECVAQTLEAVGVILTAEQLTAVTEDIYAGFSMESEAFGDLNIPNPLQTEMRRMEERHVQQVKEFEARESAYKAGVASACRVEPRDVVIIDGKCMVYRTWYGR